MTVHVDYILYHAVAICNLIQWTILSVVPLIQVCVSVDLLGLPLRYNVWVY